MTAPSATPNAPKPIAMFAEGPVVIGRIAVAELDRVVRTSADVAGWYRLSPTCPAPEFADVLLQVRCRMGQRLPVLPSTQATLVVPEDEDEIKLVITVSLAYMAALRDAARSFRAPPPALVSDLAVRMAALGYLRNAGYLPTEREG
jgi:hypothetical protein